MSDPVTGSPTDAADAGGIAGLLRALHWLGIYAALPGLMGLVGFDVFLRYGLRAPLPWGNEVGSLVLLVVFVASLPLCTRLGGHIRMDLFYGRFGAVARRGADVVSALCGLIFAGTLAYQSFETTLRFYRLGSGAYLIDLPYWPFSALLGLSAAFLCLEFSIELTRGFVAPGGEAKS